MKPFLKFGLIGGCIIAGVFLGAAVVSRFTDGGDTWMSIGEVIGYGTMIIVSIVFVALAILQTRKESAEKVLSYGQALMTGLGVTLIASLFMGLATAGFYQIVPDFGDKYKEKMIVKMADNGASMDEIEQMKTQLEQPLYNSILFQCFVMFSTMFIIGLFVSLIEAAILRN